MTYNLDTCKFDFASDNINVFVNIYDVSGSMENYERAMDKANVAFYNDFSAFEEKGSIAIAKGAFSDVFDMTSFRSVKEFNTNYSAYGRTALWDAIVESSEATIEYYNEIMKRLNVRPRVTYLVFSDGDDNESWRDIETAQNAIKELNKLDVTTVFVAFGEAVSKRIGERLGFTCTKNITGVQELIACMGSELSKSCKEQSKSAYSLKSEFFSKADKNSNEDNVEEQPILDDDFFAV